jgi:hypothetical protein
MLSGSVVQFSLSLTYRVSLALLHQSHNLLIAKDRSCSCLIFNHLFFSILLNPLEEDTFLGNSVLVGYRETRGTSTIKIIWGIINQQAPAVSFVECTNKLDLP